MTTAGKKEPILLHNKMFLIVGVEQLYYIHHFQKRQPFHWSKNVISHSKIEDKLKNNTPERVKESEIKWHKYDFEYKMEHN